MPESPPDSQLPACLPAPAAHPPLSRTVQGFIYLGRIQRWELSYHQCQLLLPAPPSLSLLPDILSCHKGATWGNMLLFFPRCHTVTKANFQGDGPQQASAQEWEEKGVGPLLTSHWLQVPILPAMMVLTVCLRPALPLRMMDAERQAMAGWCLLSSSPK